MRVKHDAHVNERKMAVLAEKIAAQVVRAMGKGLDAARVFLTARVKECVSVAAPRKPVRAPGVGGKKGGILYYRATTRAVPGVPPRKLSSRMRTSIGSKMLSLATAVIGVKARSNPTRRHPEGFNYPKFHELGSSNTVGGGAHQFIAPTVKKYRREVAGIVGKSIRLGLRGH